MESKRSSKGEWGWNETEKALKMGEEKVKIMGKKEGWKIDLIG